VSRIPWTAVCAGLTILVASGSASAVCFDPPEDPQNCEATVPTDFSGIQVAVDFVDACCTTGVRVVNVLSGTYSENVSLPQQIKLTGIGSPLPVIDGGSSGSVVDVPDTPTFGPVLLRDFELRGGAEGLSSSRATRLENVLINQTTPGGIGIHVLGNHVEFAGANIVVAADPGSTGVLVAPALAGRPTGVTLGTNVLGSIYRMPVIIQAPSGVGVDVLPGGTADLFGCDIRGTGIAVVDAGQVAMRSCLLSDGDVGLSITSDAGAALEASFCTVANNSIGVRNLNAAPGSLVYRYGIAWGNSLGDDSDLATCDQFVSSDLGDAACSAGANANHNFSIDPAFVDAANANVPQRDYHLTLASPLLDPAAAGLMPADFSADPCRDLDGTPRLKDADGDLMAIGDVGAYEIPGPPASGTLAGDITGVRFTNPTSITWNPDPLSATYSVWRGTGGPAGVSLGYSFPGLSSVAANVPGGPVADPAKPAIGMFFYYFVQGTDALGLPGTLGFGTCAERSN